MVCVSVPLVVWCSPRSLSPSPPLLSPRVLRLYVRDTPRVPFVSGLALSFPLSSYLLTLYPSLPPSPVVHVSLTPPNQQADPSSCVPAPWARRAKKKRAPSSGAGRLFGAVTGTGSSDDTQGVLSLSLLLLALHELAWSARLLGQPFGRPVWLLARWSCWLSLRGRGRRWCWWNSWRRTIGLRVWRFKAGSSGVCCSTLDS